MTRPCGSADSAKNLGEEAFKVDLGHPDRLRIGILGAGMIATAPYGILPNLAALADRIEVVAISSRTRDRAEEVARQFAIAHVSPDLDHMLSQHRLDAVINLTPIDAHFATSLKILQAGKHLISEKPLAATIQQADMLIDAAHRAGVLIIAAPIDVLGREWREARRLVAQGAIGRPTFARLRSSHAGPAMMAWPMDPSWFYQKGAGPLFDLGVYGLHRITGILGPARRVVAFSAITDPIRRARGGPFDGLEIPVTEPDNNLLQLDFGNGTFASVDATYNVVASRSPLAEIYGSEGVLAIHGAPAEPGIEIFRIDAAPGTSGWIKPEPIGFPLPPDPAVTLQRGLLVAHLLNCLDTGAAPVLSAEHARHVLEILIAARASAETGAAIDLRTSFPFPSTDEAGR
jgi:predicted dehydrogenase